MASEERGRGRLLHNMPGLLQASLNPWLVRVRNNPERLAFVLHRVTGVIILAYLVAHIFVTSATVDEALWESVMGALSGPLSRVGEWIVAGAVIFHGLNGIRLILVEFLGLGVGRPERPKPPYVPPSLRSGQRKGLYLVFALSLAGWALAGVIMFAG